MARLQAEKSHQKTQSEEEKSKERERIDKIREGLEELEFKQYKVYSIFHLQFKDTPTKGSKNISESYYNKWKIIRSLKCKKKNWKELIIKLLFLEPTAQKPE
jgi:hypothetical protein